MKKKMLLSTSVWGVFHSRAFFDCSLPTLMAEGNLPRVAEMFNVSWKIVCDLAFAEEASKHPHMIEAGRFAKIEYLVAHNEGSGEPAQLHFNHHPSWIHKSAELARESGALLMVIHPDVVWTYYAIGNIAKSLRAGALGVAIPHFRVASETAIPALEHMGADIEPGHLVRFGSFHIHPLSAAAMAGAAHGRIALELMWRVPNEGFVLRQGNRELTALDPAKMELTDLWYAGPKTRPGDLHIVTDSDEAFFLSLHPVGRDLLLYHRGRPTLPADIALMMLHPQNFSPLGEFVAAHKMRLHYGAMNEDRWKIVEAESDKFMDEAVEIMHVFQGSSSDDRLTRAEENFGNVLDGVMEGYRSLSPHEPDPACLGRWTRREVA